MNNAPFIINGKTVLIAATGTSASALVPSTGAKVNQYELYNAGTVDVFVAVTQDTSAAAVIPTGATTSSQLGNPVPAGMLKVLTGPPNATWAAITSGATANLFITPGEGN